MLLFKVETQLGKAPSVTFRCVVFAKEVSFRRTPFWVRIPVHRNSLHTVVTPGVPAPSYRTTTKANQSFWRLCAKCIRSREKRLSRIQGGPT